MVNGWKTKKLGDVAEVCMCKRIFADQTSKTGNIPFYKIGTFGKEADAYIASQLYEEYKAKYSYPEKGDVLISAAGTLGRTVVFDGRPAYFQDSNIVWLRIDKSQLCNDYLAQYYNVIKWASSEGSTISRLYNGIICDTEILIPPLEEQTVIARVLSDADCLISSLQKLIAKKKAIKQGTMQELLTGKKRLPGFYGEWKREQLPELLQEQNGIKIGPFGSQLKKEYLIDIGEFKVYGQENVYEKDFRLGTRYIPKERYLKLKSCELLPGDFVISSMGTVGKCAIVPQNIQIGIMDSHLIRLKFNCKKIIPQYILQLFSDEFDFLRNQIEKLSVGGIMDGLSTKIVQSLNVFYPVNIDEQKAICAILNDMDGEIAQLEKKLAKYQQIKQGMMQELLTGRIRLVDVDGKEQPKTQILQEKQPQPAHNQYFDDAVMIAGIVNAFYSEKYPLGRKKVQKLLYLVRRKEQADISAFHKKAAGPYADEVRYKGGEPIAQKNKYIQVKRNEKGSRFEKGVQMQQALTYLQDWGKQRDMDWLVSQFRYTSVNELELLATVDMAICDLQREGKEISVASIKDLIRSNKEWRDKLKKTYFRDSDIQRAIKKCQDLFES